MIPANLPTALPAAAAAPALPTLPQQGQAAMQQGIQQPMQPPAGLPAAAARGQAIAAAARAKLLPGQAAAPAQANALGAPPGTLPPGSLPPVAGAAPDQPTALETGPASQYALLARKSGPTVI